MSGYRTKLAGKSSNKIPKSFEFYVMYSNMYDEYVFYFDGNERFCYIWFNSSEDLRSQKSICIPKTFPSIFRKFQSFFFIRYDFILCLHRRLNNFDNIRFWIEQSISDIEIIQSICSLKFFLCHNFYTIVHFIESILTSNPPII